jgi:hypothetical protein
MQCVRDALAKAAAIIKQQRSQLRQLQGKPSSDQALGRPLGSHAKSYGTAGPGSDYPISSYVARQCGGGGGARGWSIPAATLEGEDSFLDSVSMLQGCTGSLSSVSDEAHAGARSGYHQLAHGGGGGSAAAAPRRARDSLTEAEPLAGMPELVGAADELLRGLRGL